MTEQSEKYFLGSMSAEGFRSDFKAQTEKDGVYTYILKGGAGTGKSTLMKKLAKSFEDKTQVVRFYCSSDPDSLDAVLFKGADVIVVDGTSPHTMDPDFPAVKQSIVNLGECWNDSSLQENTDEIISTTLAHKKLMKRAGSYVGAMTKLFDDTYYSVGDDLLSDKLSAYCERLVSKLFQKKHRQGSVDMSLMSALTPLGYKVWSDTLSLVEKIYLLDDDFYLASDMILKCICDKATKRGYDVLVSKCNLFSDSVYEMVVVKEAGIAFVASTPINLFYCRSGVRINAMRFYSKETLSLKKKRLRMNKSACTKLLEEAATTLAEAKSVHDEIEKFYISAMDFSLVDKAGRKIALKIKKRLAERSKQLS